MLMLFFLANFFGFGVDALRCLLRQIVSASLMNSALVRDEPLASPDEVLPLLLLLLLPQPAAMTAIATTPASIAMSRLLN